MRPTDRIPSQLNPTHIGLFRTYVSKCIFNIILVTVIDHTSLNLSTVYSCYWEAESFSADHGIPRHLEKPKARYRLHKSLRVRPILKQLRPVIQSTRLRSRENYIIVSFICCYPNTCCSEEFQSGGTCSTYCGSACNDRTGIPHPKYLMKHCYIGYRVNPR